MTMTNDTQASTAGRQASEKIGLDTQVSGNSKLLK
jgi:hypothetical protein